MSAEHFLLKVLSHICDHILEHNSGLDASFHWLKLGAYFCNNLPCHVNILPLGFMCMHGCVVCVCVCVSVLT